jgi:cytochrome c oxidase assembly protein subunit 15
VLLALLRVQSVVCAARQCRRCQAKSLSIGLWWWVLASFVNRPGWLGSTSYAVLACTDFPLASNRCGRHGLQPGLYLVAHSAVVRWRQYQLSGPAAHSLRPPVGGLRCFLFCWGGHQTPCPAAFRRDALARWPHHLQALTGLNNVVLGWPLIAAVAHGGRCGCIGEMVIIFSGRPHAARLRAARCTRQNQGSRLTACLPRPDRRSTTATAPLRRVSPSLCADQAARGAADRFMP